MRQFLRFWCHGATLAMRGTVGFANSWAWLFGVPPVAALVAYISGRAQMTTVTGRPWLDAIAIGVTAFPVTWIIGFLARLLNAPVQIYQKEKDRADMLQLRLQQITAVAPVRIDFDPWKSIVTFGDNNEYLMFSVFIVNDTHNTIHDLNLRVEGDWSGLFREPNISFDHAPGHFHEAMTICDLHPNSIMPVTLFVVPRDRTDNKTRAFTLIASGRDLSPITASFSYDDRKLPPMNRTAPNQEPDR